MECVVHGLQLHQQREQTQNQALATAPRTKLALLEALQAPLAGRSVAFMLGF